MNFENRTPHRTAPQLILKNRAPHRTAPQALPKIAHRTAPQPKFTAPHRTAPQFAPHREHPCTQLRWGLHQKMRNFPAVCKV